MPGDGGDLPRAELLDLYKSALDEYRFQVNLNWNRTQYYLALNIAILGVAVGIQELTDGGLVFLATILYLVGFVCCILSFAAAHVQHGYYRRSRDHKDALETRLNLDDLAIKTTPGMGSKIRRLGRVTTFNNVVLGILAIANVGGMIVAGTRIGDEPAGRGTDAGPACASLWAATELFVDGRPQAARARIVDAAERALDSEDAELRRAGRQLRADASADGSGSLVLAMFDMGTRCSELVS
jgi:hypothetical protein